jgi:uncharacterized protein with NAD-binding domain and iron-sulfur cluster
VIGGTAELIFAHNDRLSVTVSHADRLVEQDRDDLAATPAQLRRRPPARSAWRNLFLAGDWVATGLPATIEGAIRSGHEAARMVLTSLHHNEG